MLQLENSVWFLAGFLSKENFYFDPPVMRGINIADYKHSRGKKNYKYELEILAPALVHPPSFFGVRSQPLACKHPAGLVSSSLSD